MAQGLTLMLLSTTRRYVLIGGNRFGRTGGKTFGAREFGAQHGFWGRAQVGIIRLAKEDCGRAMRVPVFGWPTYLALSGDLGPGVHLAEFLYEWP